MFHAFPILKSRKISWLAVVTVVAPLLTSVPLVVEALGVGLVELIDAFPQNVEIVSQVGAKLVTAYNISIIPAFEPFSRRVEVAPFSFA